MTINGTTPSAADCLPCALDTTGADLGIPAQVEGAVLAWKEFGIPSILVGPQTEIQSVLSSLGASNCPFEIQNATQSISMDESPVRAVRRKPDSSLCVAFNLVQQGRASAVISAGNSGAMMAAGRMIVGLLPSIDRPAIAALIPVAGDESRANVILDSGANVDCHTQNLVQFAVMGAVYFSYLFNVERPSVAVLSNGSEPSKGNDITRSAAAILSTMESIRYVGYIEGREVPNNGANVIVCDGFVGNALLKGMEGCVRLIAQELKLELQRSLLGKLGLFLNRKALRRVFLERFDYTAHGGAPLLGLRKQAIVLHGSSNSRAVKNAIRVSESFAKRGMVDKIASALTQLEDSMPVLEGEFLSGIYGSPLNTQRAQAEDTEGGDDDGLKEGDE